MASSPSMVDVVSLKAILTDTGTELKFDVQPGQSIGAAVALHTAIAVHDQIILSADGDSVSESQSMPEASLPLFIYSRRILDSSKASVGQRKVSVRFDFEPLYQHGVLQREGKQGVFDQNCDNDCFRDYIRYITQALQIVYDNCQRQLQGLRIATINLDKHVRAYDATIQEFADAFSQFSQQIENLGSNFEELIRRLSLVEIHHALSPRQETLLDRLSEGRLRTVLARLQRDHQLVSEFVTQVYQQRKTIIDACRGETELLDEPATASALFCFPFTSLHNLKRLCSTFRKIDSEINDVRARINVTAISCSIGEGQDDLLSIEQFQLDMVDFIRNRLSSVSDIQTRIRHETKRLLAYNEVLCQKQLNLNNLFEIETVPEAYFAALIEIVRRRLYADKIFAIANQVELLRENEMRTRSIYMKEFGQLLPKEVITGLDRRPPRYFISMESINEDLPPIESLEDVELPPAFQLTDKFLTMVRRYDFDKLMTTKLPLFIKQQLPELSDAESTRDCNSSSEADYLKGIVADDTEPLVSRKECEKVSCNDISEIQTLRAALLEKDRRILDLENEKNNLTMSTALLYQENKTLKDMISRPHMFLSNFKIGDLVAVLPESRQLLNLNCPDYLLANNCDSFEERCSGRFKFGIVKSIEKTKKQKHLVNVEFLSDV